MNDSRRGFPVYNWAPQVEILSYKSGSAFLMHSGWNSVLEALSHGLPLIGWLMAAEQFFNVTLLEEKVGVCMKVTWGKSCEVRYEDIIAKIDLVMNETQAGKETRRKAWQAMETIKTAMEDEEGCKGSFVKAMDNCFSAAMSMKDSNDENRIWEKWQ
jgi:UDP:flavonoid glycosyltransferase YjiC (YdhE family)